MNLDQIALVQNTIKSRFEMLIEGYYSFILYEMIDDHTINLYHTEVNPALEGKGVGKVLVERTLEYCRLHHLKVLPTCPFVYKFVMNHPEWQDIIVSRKGYDED